MQARKAMVQREPRGEARQASRQGWARFPLVTALLAAMACAVSWGCAASAVPEADAPRQWVPEAPNVDRLAIARVLPWHTAAFVAVRDPLELADMLGRRELATRHRAAYESLFAGIVSRTGLDLLDPRAVRELGIDPDGEAAIAWLDPGGHAMALVASLSSERRFKTALYRAAALRGQRFEPQVVADALLLTSGDDRLAFVLKDGWMLAVVVKRGPSASELGHELAALGVRESLFESPDYQYAVFRGAGACDVCGYANVRALALARAGLDGRFAGETAADAAVELELARSRALATARDSAASVDELVRIDDSFRGALGALEDHPARATFGGLGGLVFALAAGDDGLSASFKLFVRDGTRFSDIVIPERTLPWLADHASGRPALLLQAHLDPDRVAALLEPWLEGGGVAGRALLSLAKDALDGEIAFELTHPLQLSAEPPYLSLSELGTHVVFGIRDSEKARALCDTLVQLGRLEPSKGGEGYVLRLPARALELSLGDGKLVLSSDGALAGGLAAAASDSVAPLSVLARALGDGGGVDFGLDVALTAIEEVEHRSAWFEPLPPYAPSPPHEQDPRYQELAKQLMQIDADHERLAASLRRRFATTELAARGRLGQLVVHAEPLSLGAAGSGLGGDVVLATGAHLDAIIDDLLESSGRRRMFFEATSELDALRSQHLDIVARLLALEHDAPPHDSPPSD